MTYGLEVHCQACGSIVACFRSKKAYDLAKKEGKCTECDDDQAVILEYQAPAKRRRGLRRAED